jgi:gliding motility-associated-like protein
MSFPITGTEGNLPTTIYTVSFSDGSPDIQFTHPPPAFVTHTFTQSSCGESYGQNANAFGVDILAQNQCGDGGSSAFPIRISDPPDADFTPSALTVCNSEVITFDDTSNPGTTANQNGCTSNAKFYWTISPASGWNVTSGALGSNNGLPNNFTIWTPGSDQLGVNLTNPGTYDVTIHYRNGCGPSEHTETVCVIEPPTCDFDVNTASGCGPLTVITDNNTIAPDCDGNDLNLNYNWQITVPTGGSYTVTSGSLTSVNPTFNFTNTITSTLVYTINLTVTPVNPQTGQAMTSCSSTCTQNITVYPAPVISTHPTPNQSICVGGTPGLLTVAYQYGVGTPTYQWYSNTINSNTGGTIINGANSTSYQPPTLNTAGNVYYYSVISLGGNCGTITSNPACVSVVADPTISNQPLATQTICSGGTATALSMTYSNGTGTATYQWYSNTTSATTGGTPISGATNASFTPSVPTTPGTYYYYGIVTLSGSGCSTATTASAAVQVIADPVVTINTLSYTYCQNATATAITPTISGGNGSITYQWYQTGSAVNTGGTAISGQTSSSFTPSTATVGTQYYYVQVTQSTSGCSSPSQPITVTILPAASFNAQPQPSTVCVGGVPNTLAATYINGTGTPSYQWYSSPNSVGSGGVAISGAISPNYTPPTNTVGTVYYYLVITFGGGGCSNITSNTAAVTVLADPTLTIAPGTSQELCVGGVITTPLTVTATGGTGTFSYQWYSNNNSSNIGGTIINGATSTNYTPPAFSTSGTYYYYATVVASGSGCDTSPSGVTSVVVVNDPIVTSQPLPVQEICQNATTTPISAAVNGGNGTATFTWYSNVTNTTTGGTQVSTSNPFTPPSSSVGTLYYYAIITQSGSGCSVTTATAEVIVTPAASFTSQPLGSTVCVGGLVATLSVAIANGLGTPNYQWYSSPNSSGLPSTAVAGATNSSFTPPATVSGNTYYFVVVTFAGGNCSNITSNTALVSVLADPTITVDAATPQTVCEENSLPAPLSFTVSSGTGNTTYQWYSNTSSSNSGGNLINNATTTSYNPPVFSTPGTYYYYAMVSSSGNGCDTSPGAVISVTVNSAATASVLGPYSSCGSTAVSVTATSNGNGSWSASPNAGTFGSPTNTNTTFTPSTGAAQDITLIWTTSDPDGVGPCPSVAANTLFTVYPPATASLPAQANLCSNETLPITATTNAPGTWSTTGSGTINPNNVATAIYTPGNNDVNNSPITLVWTTTDPDGAGPCASVSAMQSVAVTAPPVVNAGSDQTLCLNSPAINLSSTPSGGNWAGSGVTSTGGFNPVTIGTFNLTYTYEDGNNCSASDQVVINVNQSATADANGPYFVCGVAPVSISATTNGVGSWTGGAGSFANASSPNTTYTPALSELGATIDLTWSTFDPDNTGPCSGAADIAQLTVNTPANASPGGPYAICSSDVASISVTSSPTAGNWSGGQGTIASATSTSTTYTPAAEESGNSAELTWTTIDPDNSGPCPAVSVQVTVNVLEAAIAEANGPYFVCGVNPVSISATSNGVGTWSGGLGIFANASSPNTSYTPALSELGATIDFTWTTFDPDNTGPCSGASDVTQLTVNIPATASPGGPYSICSSDVASISVTSSPTTGSWSGGQGAFGSATSTSTAYTPATEESGNSVQLTWTTIDPDNSGPCPAVSVQVIVNVLEAAIADANGPYFVCGASPVNISATTNGTGSWTGGEGTFQNATNSATSYQPSTNEIGDVIELTWTTFDPDNSGPCTGASDVADITITVPATAVPGGPYTICSSDVANIEVITTPGGGTWTGGQGDFGSSTGSSTTYDPAESESASNVELTWTTVDPDGSGPCPAETAAVFVNILEAAIADANGPYFVCGTQVVSIVATTNGTGTWSGGAGLFENASNSSTTYTPDITELGQTIVLTWDTFDPDGNGPCSGASDTVELTISTPATAVSGGPYAICSNGTANIEVTTTPGAGSWSGGTGSFADVEASATVYTPLASEGGTTVYLEWQTVDPDGNGPCPVETASVELNILEQATASIEGPFEVCTTDEVAIASVSNGPGEWTMNPAVLGSLADNTSNTTTFTPLVNDLYDNYEVTLEWTTFDPDGDGPCASFATTDIITIHALPVVSLQPNYTIDCGDIIGASVTGGSGAGYSYQWSPTLGLIDSEAISTPVNASGTYQISITDDNGCSDIAETSVIINALDQMAQAEDVETCLFESVELIGQATLGAAPFTYAWSPAIHINPGNGQSASVNFLYSQALTQDTTFTYTLNISDALGCSDNETVFVTIHPLPVVNAGPDEAFCTYDPAFVLDGYSPDPQTGLSSNWTPSDNIDPATLPVGDNVFTYEFTDLNTCINTDTRTITIHEVPVAEFQFPLSACEGSPVQFNNQSSCGSCGALQYQWYFGDGLGQSSNASPSFTFVDTGYVDITLIVQSSFGCADSITHTIHILALPETSFLLSENTGCGPIDIHITNTTVGAELTYTWNIDSYGTTSVEEPGTITFPAAPCDSIFYQVYLEAENICGMTSYEDEILVYSPPQPLFNVSSDTICSSLPVSLFNATTCAWQTTYSWDLGDGTIFTSEELIIDHVYYAFDDFGQYEITLSATNQCGVTENTQILTVVPNTIDAFFNANPVNGCEPLPVNFDQEMNGVTYFAWDFGDGSTSLDEDPVHIFQSEGSYEVSFIAGNFCGAQDTACQLITVLPAPVFDFVSSEDYLCIGEPTSFTAFGDPIYGYQWSFGDGNTSTAITPSHIYEATGEYEVTLTALSSENGCPTTITNIIEVITTPNAQILADTLEGCPPFMVNFTNNSTDAVNYFWNLDDGTSYVGDTLEHVFESSGTYNVQVIAINSNSCADTANVSVTVYPSPTAAFTYSTNDDYLALDVRFTNRSENAIAYEWDFGDGDGSFSANPFHSYMKDGKCIYEPTLKAYNAFGCEDVTSEAIELPFELKVHAPNAFSPNNDNLNDIFIVVTQDVDPVFSHLQIFDRWGVMVHEARGANPSWNGNVVSELATNDAYVWIYKTRKKCGYKEEEFKGHVIVVR